VLEVTAQNLISEIRSAERLRDAHIKSMGEQVEKFHGPWYKQGSANAEYAPENHYYEYISLMIPRLVYDNPRVRVKTRRPGSQADVAEATRHALNRWVRDTGLSDMLIKTATDMLFNFGIVLTTEAVNKGVSSDKDVQGEGKPMWPTCSRVPQNRFVIDPAATSLEDARYMGHKWIRDKEDLLKMAKDNPGDGWNEDVIKELAVSSDPESLGRERQHVPDRDEVVCYEIWVPEVELPESLGPDEGFHGTIYTLAINTNPEDGEDKAGFVRKPRPYYGPRWGPYTMFGVYHIPNSIYPLSPLAAIEGQIQDLNTHTTAMSASAENYKKLILVDDTDPKFIQRVKDARDSFVIPVSGLDRARVMAAEIGGITQQQILYTETAKERLERNSGISDAQRGNVTGSGTATEHSIATEASSIRLAYVRRQWAQAVTSLLKTAAWFFYYDDRVIMPLGEEGQQALGVDDPWLQGGNHDRESGATFDDLELEIEPFSMERTTEGQYQRRVLEMYQIVMQLAPAIPQMPHVNWKTLMSRLADALNLPEMRDIINVDVASMMGGMQAGAGESEPGTGTAAQPRYSEDLGQAGAQAPPAVPGQPSATKATPDLMPGQVSGIQSSNAVNYGQPMR
jgi:hypothetical protein